MSTTNAELSDVVDDLANSIRQSNLIVKGLGEAEGDQDGASTTSIVRAFTSGHLGVTLEEDGIEKAYRIGRAAANID